MPAQLVEGPEGWSVPSIRGLGVARVVLNFQVHLHVGPHTVVIESPFTIERDGSVFEVVPETQEGSDAAESLLGAVVSAVEAGHDGRLLVRFADKSALRVEPDENYEAWQVFLSGRSALVALPGGGVAVWSDD